jgi:hypothetical protein
MLNGQDLSTELDRLRRDKQASVYELRRYKKKISGSIVFAIIGFAVGLGMVIWRYSPVEPTWEQLRESILSTQEEDMRLCVTMYPNSIAKDNFDIEEVGQPLLLTPYIEDGLLDEAAEAARVDNVLQSVVSASTKNYNNSYNLFCNSSSAFATVPSRLLCCSSARQSHAFDEGIVAWRVISKQILLRP